MGIHRTGKFNATQRRDFSSFTHDKFETFSSFFLASFLVDGGEFTEKTFPCVRRLIFMKIHFLSLSPRTLQMKLIIDIEFSCSEAAFPRNEKSMPIHAYFPLTVDRQV